MAVVTEPAWLNKNAGVSRTNATTETINFGFTATTGSFLVVIMGAPVTHTVSAGGWTEQLSPVNSCELSVFTATATTSPDNRSSITVAHNAANYPIGWVAYEFPTGTTFTGAGASSTASGDTFPALGSLPGTAQTIIAAYTTSNGSTDPGHTITGAVAAPWAEDHDVSTNRGGTPTTDGVYFYAFHQLNVTATSITPAWTPTSVGAAYPADREKVVIALDVATAGGGGPTSRQFFAMF